MLGGCEDFVSVVGNFKRVVLHKSCVLYVHNQAPAVVHLLSITEL